jgi:hypothetical protein
MSPKCSKARSCRLIGKLLCINCYNRQLEWLNGKNAGGIRPVTLARVRAAAGIDPTTSFGRCPCYPIADMDERGPRTGDIRGTEPDYAFPPFVSPS